MLQCGRNKAGGLKTRNKFYKRRKIEVNEENLSIVSRASNALKEETKSFTYLMEVGFGSLLEVFKGLVAARQVH